MSLNMLLDYKVLFYLNLILVFSLIPVYIYKRSWKEVFAVAFAIVCFFIINSDFFSAVRSPYGSCHDTFYTYEYLLSILKQWLDKGVSIGWNPYLNGGEPFYLFSNYFLWTPWIVFCWVNRFINISPHLLFTCFWVFIFVNFSVGSFLLFSLLYDNFKAAFFSFISLMFSTMFIVNLIQPTGITLLYYLPYLLFAIISSFKNKNVYGLALGIIFMGILSNHYLPIYIIVCLDIFIILSFCFNLINLESLSPLRKQLFDKYKVILLAIFLSILAASPGLYTYSKFKSFVSLTRGGTVGGVLKSKNTGTQRSVVAPLEKYSMLFNPPPQVAHHAFYFGIVPLLMVFFAITFSEKRAKWVFLSTAVMIAYLGVGRDSDIFLFVSEYVPGCDMIRHTFGFAQFATFFLICCAGYGFKYMVTVHGLSEKA